ncbi:MAG TPA: hypothetical protein DIU15_17215, partial [Deltaproteobacteria bacterium]|nr:hypothetical protein [Deltaproteobacteria bacterium]
SGMQSWSRQSMKVSPSSSAPLVQTSCPWARPGKSRAKATIVLRRGAGQPTQWQSPRRKWNIRVTKDLSSPCTASLSELLGSLTQASERCGCREAPSPPNSCRSVLAWCAVVTKDNLHVLDILDPQAVGPWAVRMRPVNNTSSNNPAPLPLDGVVVLDLSRILAGPYATQILGDLGATVWKVEHPERGDDTRGWGPVERAGESAYFLSVNRNKKSIGIDLKSDEGRNLVLQLAKKADVVFENFPPGKLDGLGLGFEALRKVNPKVLLTSVTAFGQKGPLSHEPGYDLIVQGYGGIMSLTGPVEGPPYRVGVPIVDLTTGLNAALGTLAALRAAERDGVGQHVDISLFDTHLAWLANVAGNTLLSGEPSPRLGNAHPN